MSRELLNLRLVDCLRMAFDEYRQEVNATRLAAASKQSYIGHAEEFVRWIEGTFEPSAGKASQGEAKDEIR